MDSVPDDAEEYLRQATEILKLIHSESCIQRNSHHPPTPLPSLLCQLQNNSKNFPTDPHEQGQACPAHNAQRPMRPWSPELVVNIHNLLFHHFRRATVVDDKSCHATLLHQRHLWVDSALSFLTRKLVSCHQSLQLLPLCAKNNGKQKKG